MAASDTVTITASFNEAMTSTPTISIAGTSISNQVMTKIIGGSDLGPHTVLGADIDGEATYDESGYSVSLSSDGSRVAIGAPYSSGCGPNNNSGCIPNAGSIRIYELQS